jgi:hypothetical protein
VPGTQDVRITVADGAAGDVLMYVASQFDARVEDLDLDSSRGELDDWGYAARPIRGGTTTSNHASATAEDFNATRHPLDARGTFTRQQVNNIHTILAEVDNVVRWGGDYSGRADEMHFEINAGPAAVQRVADRLRNEGTGFLMSLSAQEQRNIYNRIMAFLRQRFWKTVDGKAVEVAGNVQGAIPCAALDTLDGAYIVGLIGKTTERIIRLEAAVASAAGQQVTEDDIAETVDQELAEFLTEFEQLSIRDAPSDQEV